MTEVAEQKLVELRFDINEVMTDFFQKNTIISPPDNNQFISQGVHLKVPLLSCSLKFSNP
jgi:hypothetical protein